MFQPSSQKKEDRQCHF